MTPGNQLAGECARQIVEAFSGYNSEFRAITRRATGRFEARDWHAGQADAVERIELYDRCVDQTVARLRLLLGDPARDQALWAGARAAFAEEICEQPDSQFTKTFFSSISRRLFGTVGVAPGLEFVATELDPLAGIDCSSIIHAYINRGSLRLLVENLLGDLRFRCPWIDLERTVANVTSEIAAGLRTAGAHQPADRIELIRPVFFQSTRAYVVGRVTAGDTVRPLLLALKNTDQGLVVDAVMLDENDVSVVFGFTRSYFHVDLERVGEAVAFLRQLLPRKPVSELFTVLGRAKQGKTERYREIVMHLQGSDDLFAHAPGERGLVMVCFTLPSLDMVFKLVRDRFPPPKTVSRQEVFDKYRFVFKHDRAGRLVDAQEFKRVRLPRARFTEALLEELFRETAGTVRADGDDLIFDHMYIERRMVPLNIFLRQAPVGAAEMAVLEYGQAIRDLAYTNIFAGDLLLKNFGVTRHGRVIFYDYDELCQVTECHYRDIPEASNEEDQMRGEAWFYVADNDVFPETFINFLSFNDAQRRTFLRVHGDILTPGFWRHVQQRVEAGEILEVLPYHPSRAPFPGSG